MTEKRYKMVNTNLVDDDGLVYYLIKKDGRDVCQVFGKHTAKAIVTELNALHEENVKLQARNKYLATKIQRERNIHVKEHEKWEEEIQKENEAFKKALVELKEIGDYQEGRIKELNDENEQLKLQNQRLDIDIKNNQLAYYDLEKENEQLKQFQEKVFDLLDEKIKHYEHKPFSAPIGQPMSVNFDADMDRLARLSELELLKEELLE